MEDKFNSIINQICEDKEIRIIDIPCVDLYMDQVTSFFDDKMSYLKRNNDDKILTKTMINNYSKDKILIPQKNKKYSRQNMILLILIYNLKQILSISDISTLFSKIIPEDQKKTSDNALIEEIYNKFLEIKSEDSAQFKSSFESKADIIIEKLKDSKIDDKEYAELFLMVLTLIDQANMRRRFAEKIIDGMIEKK